MGQRGQKPQAKVKMKWSADFAYAVGLIVTDGCLYNDGRHICLVSKDIDQIGNLLKCLKINNKISEHYSGSKNLAWRVQIGDVSFYKFLESIGITSAKSKTIGPIKIPDKFFLIFYEGLLTVTDVFTHIGTKDGSPVICFTLNLFQQVKSISCGYKNRYHVN